MSSNNKWNKEHPEAVRAARRRYYYKNRERILGALRKGTRDELEALKAERAALLAVLAELVDACQQAHIAYMTNPKTGWIPAMDNLFRVNQKARALVGSGGEAEGQGLDRRA